MNTVSLLVDARKEGRPQNLPIFVTGDQKTTQQIIYLECKDPNTNRLASRAITLDATLRRSRDLPG